MIHAESNEDGSPETSGEARSDGELVSALDLRETGIGPIGKMPWGTHICVFYETRKDLLDTCTAYFAAGIDSNEFCVWAVSSPITEEDAADALRRVVPNCDHALTTGRIEILRGTEWYLKGDQFDLGRITRAWNEKIDDALARGYDGIRVSGNAFWVRSAHWNDFNQYELELDQSIAGTRMLALCTYPLQASGAAEVLDVARAHSFTLARRSGQWEFLQTPELQAARLETARLRGAADILSKPFPGRHKLAPRERAALSQIVRGATSKEAARNLGLSPRTIEYHRANIIKKLNAKNTADLVRKVLEGTNRRG